MLKVNHEVKDVPEKCSPGKRSTFTSMNKHFMLPMSTWGFLPWMQNPLTGYIMVLQTIGRRSGKARLTPLNYALSDGYLYCMAGFGQGTDWLANLKANPNVEIHFAGTAVRGTAEIVTDNQEAEHIFIQIIHNCGFASLFVGLNPFMLTDEKILSKYGPQVAVRIRPTEIVGGTLDPGGRGWVLSTFLLLAGKICAVYFFLAGIKALRPKAR